MNRTCVRFGQLSMICLSLSGCAEEMATESDVEGVNNAIINGTVNEGDPAVVMLRNGPDGHCTGTLVSPNVVVTAAHCVEGIDVTSVGFGVNGQSTPVGVSEQIAHPRWNGYALESGYDVAVLILERSVSDVAPIPVSSDLGAARAGDAVRIVGFGDNTSRGGFGTKRQASSSVAPIEVDDGVSEERFVKVGDSSGTQACSGDSGGPVFHADDQGLERVVGVTSFGYFGCRGGAFHTRLAAYSDFLDDYLAVAPPDAGEGDEDDEVADDVDDTQAPSVRLVSPADGSTLSSGLREFVFEASDDTAVADVVLNWNGGRVVVSCASPLSRWTCTQEGTRYTFSARIGKGIRRLTATATDTSGNSTTTPQYALAFR